MVVVVVAVVVENFAEWRSKIWRGGREGGRETDGDKRGAGKQFQTIIRERERDDSEF
jgi:hypothetical protein